jgi:hypothetical protein
MHDTCGFRVRMSKLSDGYRYHMPAKHPDVTPQSSPWALLHLWIDQVQQHEGLDRMSAVHLPFEQPQEFARTLRQLDWRVYHYRVRKDFTQDSGSIWVHDPYYAPEWGYIVAPYCGKFVFWQLSQS